MQILKNIVIKVESRRPKYRQIVDSIIENISLGRLKIDDKIPSINMLSEEFCLSRDTVEKAYNILKEDRIITSVKGKGFYVTAMPCNAETNVLFLVNKISNYKMQIYHAFRAAAGEDVKTDLNIYHCDETLFLCQLRQKNKSYDYYVIMPHFTTANLRHVSATEEVLQELGDIPSEKLLLLDNRLPELEGDFPEVYQDFEEDIYQALSEAREIVSNYDNIVITYPSHSLYPYPRRILRGFRKFCVKAKLPFSVIEEITEGMELQEGTLYLCIPESDLVNLVRAARDQGFTPGKEIGIISYNETPLKDLLGITTISTDFEAMGRSAAGMVKNKSKEKIKNPFILTYRASLGKLASGIRARPQV